MPNDCWTIVNTQIWIESNNWNAPYMFMTAAYSWCTRTCRSDEGLLLLRCPYSHVPWSPFTVNGIHTSREDTSCLYMYVRINNPLKDTAVGSRTFLTLFRQSYLRLGGNHISDKPVAGAEPPRLNPQRLMSHHVWPHQSWSGGELHFRHLISGSSKAGVLHVDNLHYPQSLVCFHL